MTNTQLTSQLKIRSFTLGGFTVNPQEHTLCLNSAPNDNSEQSSDTIKTHQLPTKCIEVLCYLVERYPEVISRQELIDTIWEGNVSVGQKSLTNAIWSLRKVLNQNSEQIQAITTIRKSGYKLELEPHYLDEDPSNISIDEKQTQTPSLNNAPETNDEQGVKHSNNGQLQSVTKITKVNLATAFIFGVLLFVGLFTGLNLMGLNGTGHIGENSGENSGQNSNAEPISKLPTVLPRINTITNHPGRELYPSISADGRWLAYIWFRVDLTSELLLIDLQSKEKQTTRLTVSPNRDLKPTWHPNNQDLFMIRKDSTNKRCQIIKVNRQTKTSAPLVNCSFKAHGFLSIDKQGE